jgi:DNA processing protein
VISGGAVGIDAAAHEGALDGGGRTVAVLPCGPEALHPKENADLLDRIAEADGALLWPFPWGTRADRPRFFFRNAVMVALSHAVVITAAGVPSGALNAAKHARALGVPRFVVVGPPWEGRLRGGLSELARGATAIESVGSLLRELSRRAIAPPLGSLLTSSSSR